jgi:hypothetical protein
MACSGCPGSSRKPARASAFNSVMAAPRPVAQAEAAMHDDQFIMVRYITPRRGGHPVSGTSAINPATGRHYDYGDRRSGDRFLMHRDDVYMIDRRTGQQILRNPTLFQPIEEKAATPPPIPPKETPPPEPLVKEPEPDNLTNVDLEHAMNAAFVQSVDMGPIDEAIQTGKVVPERSLDLQMLPGVNASIAAAMRAAGLTKREDILALGEDGLQAIPGIGEKKAQKIMEWLQR